MRLRIAIGTIRSTKWCRKKKPSVFLHGKYVYISSSSRVIYINLWLNTHTHTTHQPKKRTKFLIASFPLLWFFFELINNNDEENKNWEIENSKSQQKAYYWLLSGGDGQFNSSILYCISSVFWSLLSLLQINKKVTLMSKT